MSRALINRDPAGYIYDGRELVGFLFDTAAGTVATLPDRLPLGTFSDWKAARAAIREALHPETRHGGDRASRQVGDLKEPDRFIAATGRTDRAIQHDDLASEVQIP